MERPSAVDNVAASALAGAAPARYDKPSLGRRSTGADILAQFDTTRLSLLHACFGGGTGSKPQLALAFALASCATYVPLLVVAIGSLSALGHPYANVKLPFLLDVNVMFMLLVSLPSVVVFTVGDNQRLATSIAKIAADNIIDIDDVTAGGLIHRWEKRFRTANVVSQILGAAIGGIVAWANYKVYNAPSVGYWIAERGQMTAAGWVFLYCVFVFYSVPPIYILRSLMTALFLRDLVAESTVQLIPFHPDRCGGLRPVGSLGLRNQYLLTTFGLNLVTLIYVSARYLSLPPGVVELVIAGASAYLIFGPLVFLAPLIPFRDGMLRSKTDLLRDVAERMRTELARIRDKMSDGPITKDDDELIQRLRSIGTLIDELPVWPFDARTLRKFLTAYVVPIAGSAGLPLVRAVGGYLAQHF